MKIIRDGILYIQNRDFISIHNCDEYAPADFVNRDRNKPRRNKGEFLPILNEAHLYYLSHCEWICDIDEVFNMSEYEIENLIKIADAKRLELEEYSYNYVEPKSSNDSINEYIIWRRRFVCTRSLLYDDQIKQLQAMLILKERINTIKDCSLEEIYKYTEEVYSINYKDYLDNKKKYLSLHDTSLKQRNTERIIDLEINSKNEYIGKVRGLNKSIVFGKIHNNEMIGYYKESPYSIMTDFIGKIDFEKNTVTGEYWITGEDKVYEFSSKNQIDEINKIDKHILKKM